MSSISSSTTTSSCTAGGVSETLLFYAPIFNVLLYRWKHYTTHPSVQWPVVKKTTFAISRARVLSANSISRGVGDVDGSSLLLKCFVFVVLCSQKATSNPLKQSGSFTFLLRVGRGPLNTNESYSLTPTRRNSIHCHQQCQPTPTQQTQSRSRNTHYKQPRHPALYHKQQQSPPSCPRGPPPHSLEGHTDPGPICGTLSSQLRQIVSHKLLTWKAAAGSPNYHRHPYRGAGIRLCAASPRQRQTGADIGAPELYQSSGAPPSQPSPLRPSTPWRSCRPPNRTSSKAPSTLGKHTPTVVPQTQFASHAPGFI